jgi:predicted phage tail protein
MGKYVQYSGLFLIILGALLLIASYFAGWNNINAVNVGSFAAMIIGLIAYIFGGKRDLEN